MATAVASMVAGAILNGVAFSGSSYLFRALDKQGADKERKRHDEAMEQFQRDTEKWNKDRIKKLDFINRELREKNIAEKDLSQMDDAMTLYSTFANKTITIRPKPVFSDYYQPSEEMRQYEYLWIILGTSVIGFIAYKYG